NGATREYCPHLTLGQSRAQGTPMCEFLLDKARLLPSIEWQLNELVILVRERSNGPDNASSKMKIWATIDLSANVVSRVDISSENEGWTVSEPSTIVDRPLQSVQIRADIDNTGGISRIEPR